MTSGAKPNTSWRRYTAFRGNFSSPLRLRRTLINPPLLLSLIPDGLMWIQRNSHKGHFRSILGKAQAWFYRGGRKHNKTQRDEPICQRSLAATSECQWNQRLAESCHYKAAGEAAGLDSRLRSIPLCSTGTEAPQLQSLLSSRCTRPGSHQLLSIISQQGEKKEVFWIHTGYLKSPGAFFSIMTRAWLDFLPTVGFCNESHRKHTFGVKMMFRL